MAKIVLNDITSTSQVSVLNSNFDKIESALNDKVLYRDCPVDEPNALVTNVDANGRRIYNLPKAITLNEPLRWQDLVDLNGGVPGVTLPIGASDVGVIPFDSYVSTNVQDALEEIAAAVGGGGGGLPANGGTTVANFSMSAATPDRRVVVASTLPNGWNLIPGTQTLDFQLVSNNYFAANPSGHFAVVLRCDTANIATTVSGQGIAVGALEDIGLPISDEGPTYKPASQIETWSPGNVSNRWIYPYTWSGEQKKMVDGATYRFIIDSTVSDTGVKYIRYRRFKYFAARATWDLEVDTGDVLDTNANADLTHEGLAFGEVFGSDLSAWSLDFSNIKVTWRPAYSSATDGRAFLSRFSPEVEGDLWFVGGPSKIYVNNSGSASTWTAFMNKAANSATQVIVAPNGTSTTSSFVAINSSGMTNFGAVAMGAFNTHAAIGTSNFGSGTVPELRLEYGFGNWLAKLTSTGMYLKDATLSLGREPSTFANLTNTGGTASRAFANSGSPFDIEALCIEGAIGTVLASSTYFTVNQSTTLENALRPLYCLLSTAIDLAKKKGTI